MELASDAAMQKVVRNTSGLFRCCHRLRPYPACPLRPALPLGFAPQVPPLPLPEPGACAHPDALRERARPGAHGRTIPG